MDFDLRIERRNTNSYKWDLLNDEFSRDDLIPMWVADMDFKSPAEITEALARRVEHGVFGYTTRPSSYYEAILYWLAEKHSWPIDKDWVINTPGVVPALSAAVLTFTKPGDKVIIQPPVYHPFFSAVEGNGRKLVHNGLKLVNGRYEMDFEDLEDKIDSKTKMLILCSPHNPVGRVWNEDELKRLGEICLNNNIIIVSDEIHSDIVYSCHKHVPISSLSKELADITITCMAPSKTFNIAGLATSYAIIPNDSNHLKFKKTLDNLGISMGNLFGITALEAAYIYGDEWLKKLLKYLEINADYLTDFVNNNIEGITVYRPEGTYLGWLDCRGLNIEPERIKEFMIHEARVGLSEGSAFGSEYEGFMRINFGCPKSILEEGLLRIKTAVNKRNR